MSNIRTLVLGAGGLTGIGWETGLIAGLAQQGIELGDADRIIGSSAGSTVGARLACGVAPEEAYRAQLDGGAHEVPAAFGFRNVVGLLGPQLLPGSDAAIARRIGRAALRTATVSESERRAIIAQRVPGEEWPRKELLITAIDASTGERRVFTRDSGVSLVDAVAASCAVPTVWPAVSIGAARYIDGGVLSSTNTDLARINNGGSANDEGGSNSRGSSYDQGGGSADLVLVLAPIPGALRKRWSAAAQLKTLGPQVRTLLITPDGGAKQAMGRNSLNPAFRAAAARAGREQAKAVAAAVGRLWS
ncbi:patatin-like phospholipase family protein [Paenarthrobacter sp. Z7-10]|uniref:patatin-like phospholipase family protein n=1 Tax=Paenarthrobacter sp. Z7-10 TaxID=2787635 RepID=UPI0022A8DC65|nr:patatin-like phospholipase family protein [Paenarthrobacter sp. Z7-10]MCZ2403170.1 patatin-like phospholipase family protein [Paenarthrobacter sp. Z7-10]